jgi:hypothetical protein
MIFYGRRCRTLAKKGRPWQARIAMAQALHRHKSNPWRSIQIGGQEDWKR